MAEHAHTVQEPDRTPVSVSAESASAAHAAGEFDGAIAATTSIEPLPYTAEDYRRELKRAKRSHNLRVALLVVVLLLVAAAIVAVFVLHIPGFIHATFVPGTGPLPSIVVTWPA